MIDLYTVCVCSLAFNVLSALLAVYNLYTKNKSSNLSNKEKTFASEDTDVHSDLHNRLLQIQQQTYGRKYHTVTDDLAVMSMPRRRRK